MASLTDYFTAKSTPPTHKLGDRVFGRLDGVPYIGTTGFSRIVDEDGTVKVPVMLDLPLKKDEMVYNIIMVGPDEIERLKVYD